MVGGQKSTHSRMSSLLQQLSRGAEGQRWRMRATAADASDAPRAS